MGSSPQAEGGSTASWLHRPLYQVSFNIKNTGHAFGAGSPQLNPNFPASSGEPLSVLRSFDSVTINPEDTVTVTMMLSRYHLSSIWDVVAQGWRKPAGTLRVTVGAINRDARLNGTLPGSV